MFHSIIVCNILIYGHLLNDGAGNLTFVIANYNSIAFNSYFKEFTCTDVFEF